MPRKPARLYLTRQHNGHYLLSFFEPVIAPVRGAGHDDAYVRTGDPVGVRHLCPGGVKLIFGMDLPPLKPVRVTLLGDPLGDFPEPPETT
jgi:hypothetical protein